MGSQGSRLLEGTYIKLLEEGNPFITIYPYYGGLNPTF